MVEDGVGVFSSISLVVYYILLQIKCYNLQMIGFSVYVDFTQLFFGMGVFAKQKKKNC